MANPLNPSLHRRLKRCFGSVQISSEGEKMIAHAVKGIEGEPLLDISHNGEYYRVNCFAGETQVATRSGDKPIRDLLGVAELLVPNSKGVGAWKPVSVRSFGVQPLLRVTLKRKGAEKVIRTTPRHRWVVSGYRGTYSEKTTDALKPGDKLASCFVRTLASYGDKIPNVSAIGVAQGFVFGDGSHETGSRKPTTLRFYARSKDTALLPYYASCRRERKLISGKWCWEVYDLPRTWKALPTADESMAFLLGWLAGYVAADGHVSRNGKQATLYSASTDNLQFAKGVCYQLGIRVGTIRSKRRKSVGCVPGGDLLPMYALTFSVRDVPAEFWIQKHHRSRAAKWLKTADVPQKTNWSVVSVEDRGELEEVFCAIVPLVEKFTLADNLMTMNCPFCNDTKHRLYVNHMYGQKDGHGRSMTFLANCFNEFCLARPENRAKFSEQVFDTDIQTAKVKPGVEVSEDAREVDWPGPCVPISKLKAKDVGKAYLVGRDFDVDRLYEKFGVMWCVDSRYSLARNRITIPVFEKGKLKGWQCRLPADLDWKGPKKKELPPKYFGCPGAHFRSKCVYNFDEMKKWETGIIVEGPSDVWRFGLMAGCIFGNTVTEIQRKKLLGAFSKRTLVMLLDPEEFDSKNVRRNVEYLEGRMPGRFCAVKLPDGTDPGSLDRFFLREYVREQAAKQGVKVKYRRVR